MKGGRSNLKALTGVVLAAGLMMAFGGIAHADINPVGNPTVTPSGSNFLWQYTLATDAAQVVNTALIPSFFTLYDVNGLVPGSENYTPLALAGTASSALVGPTPVGVLPTDSPTIPNVSVSFLGTAGISTNLGVLSFLDTQPGSNVVVGQFSAQGINASNGSRAFNSSFVESPAPEPGSLALLSSGVLGMVGMGLRRFKRG